MKKAFTLAEVLITIGIVGVVAAFTIPTLMANSQKAQYLTALKKVYSQFNQALLMLTNDYGCNGDLKCTGLFSNFGNITNFGNEIVKYLKVVKTCNNVSSCFDNNIHVMDAIDGTGDDGGYDDNFSENYNVQLADGSVLSLLWGGLANCSLSASKNVTNNMTQLCGALIIDVNGTKGPNYWGRDIFMFYITNGKGAQLYPEGGVDDNENGVWQINNIPRACDKKYPSGQACAGRVIEEGWQMNY